MCESPCLATLGLNRTGARGKYLTSFDQIVVCWIVTLVLPLEAGSEFLLFEGTVWFS